MRKRGGLSALDTFLSPLLSLIASPIHFVYDAVAASLLRAYYMLVGSLEHQVCISGVNNMLGILIVVFA